MVLSEIKQIFSINVFINIFHRELNIIIIKMIHYHIIIKCFYKLHLQQPTVYHWLNKAVDTA